MNINTSIIIVTYNCSAFIERFFDELNASLTNYSGFELLVFDNASRDETPKLLQKIEGGKTSIFLSNENAGFSAANNILIRKAKYENILLLNPDVFGFDDLFWQKLFQLWDKRNPLFIKLLNEDLTFQDCVGDVSGPERALKNIFKKADYQSATQPIKVGMGIMAFMMANRACFNKVGLLSEDYHMYAEDMDWCYRASKAGFDIIFDPRLQLVHIGGGSAKTVADHRKTLLIKYQSQKKFIKKNFKGLKQLISLLMTDIIIAKTRLLK